MNRIKNYYNAYPILFCVIFTLSLLGCAENVVVRKPVNVVRSQNGVDRKPTTVASAEKMVSLRAQGSDFLSLRQIDR